MHHRQSKIIEALVAGGRCTLTYGEPAPQPESFAATVDALEETIALAVHMGELPSDTDTRALAILGAATVAGLELARWELGPGADVLAPYEIFARAAVAAVTPVPNLARLAVKAS